jgi:hypothetical protein
VFNEYLPTFHFKKPETWIMILHALLALFGSRGSVDNIKIIYGLDSTGFISWLGLEIFCSQTSSRPVLGPNSLLFMDQDPVPWVKQLECEVNHFSQSRTKVHAFMACTRTSSLFIKYDADARIKGILKSEYIFP